jgi:hypothetical protein
VIAKDETSGAAVAIHSRRRALHGARADPARLSVNGIIPDTF